MFRKHLLIIKPINMINLNLKPIFTKTKIVKYDDLNKQWFVYFRYDKKQFRYKNGINYYKTYKERLQEAKALCCVLDEKLRAGWDPINNTLEEETPKQSEQKTMYDALLFALDKKQNNICKMTYNNYRCTVQFVLKKMKQLKLNQFLATDFKRVHFFNILTEIQKERNWEGKAFNKHLGYLKAVVSELIQWEIIETNPCFHIKLQKTTQNNANIPATESEMQSIKKHLELVFPNYFTFISVIYHTGIRPVEILRLKCGMINLDRKEITIPANLTKTNKERVVPINVFLLEKLKHFNLNNNDYFVFGTNKKTGGKIDKDNYFCPNPYPIKRDTPTKLWYQLVKKELGINANQYSMKHKGANDKIIDGMDLDALRHLYGHGSKLMTERYGKIIKEVYKNEIMSKSRDL